MEDAGKALNASNLWGRGAQGVRVVTPWLLAEPFHGPGGVDLLPTRPS